MYNNIIKKSCLDHISTNATETWSKPEVLAAGNSDHLGIYITKYSKEIRHKPQTTKKRSYKYFNKGEFLNEIKSTNFDSVLSSEDPDTASATFEEIFKNILDKYAPIKIFQTRKNYAPWLSDETKKMIDKRNELKMLCKSSHDLQIIKDYKSLRNKIKSLLKNEKSKYYQEKFSNPEITTKQVWKTTYEFLGNVSDKSPTNLHINNENCTSPEIIANTINETFSNKVKRLKSTLTGPVTINPIKRLSNWLKKRPNPIPTFKLKEITIEDLRRHLKKVKGLKSCGTDQIDSYSIKISAPFIEEVLLHLINISIKKNKIPNAWKNQLIFPFYKKGNRTDP